MGGASEASAHERVLAAYRALRADPSIQFGLPPTPPDPPTPGWLRVLGRWFRTVGRAIGHVIDWLGRWLPDWPYARILLWAALAIVAATILLSVAIRLRTGSWRWPLRRRRRPLAGESDPAAEWMPDAAPARALLREADRLAEEGRYAEAAHLLLQRSIEDIARRRPHLLRPALTSRDIAASPLPGPARNTFSAIAGVVERSLFAGGSVDRFGWDKCRAAYADFALPKAWA